VLPRGSRITELTEAGLRADERSSSPSSAWAWTVVLAFPLVFTFR
jgi:hypothetical protein